MYSVELELRIMTPYTADVGVAYLFPIIILQTKVMQPQQIFAMVIESLVV